MPEEGEQQLLQLQQIRRVIVLVRFRKLEEDDGSQRIGESCVRIAFLVSEAKPSSLLSQVLPAILSYSVVPLYFFHWIQRPFPSLSICLLTCGGPPNVALLHTC